MSAHPVALLSLATAVPPHLLSQEEAKATGRVLYAGRKELFDRLGGVFDHAGIATRHIVAPLDWYHGNHGWADRNALYLAASEQLFLDSSREAIAAAGLVPADIDGVVTVSTTGIATPSLEARFAAKLGLRHDVRRVPIFGLGCAGGVSGVATAARLATASPGSHWLFVTVETCSSSIRLDSDDPASVIATALFGDGAAAAVVRSGPGGLATIRAAEEQWWPDTLGIMGWRVEDPGFGVIFDRAIPPFIEAELKTALTAMLERMGTGLEAIDRMCCHPGGAKVIDAIETAMDLSPGSLDLEREVLRDFGNMSAPTVLFVLKRLIERGLPETTLATAFGPGFTCSAMLLDRP